MKALVSAFYNTLLVDLETGEETLIDNNKKFYHGITWDEDQSLYLTHTNLTPQIMGANHSPSQNIGYVSANLVKMFEPFAALHDLNYWEGRLFINNTGCNCLSILDGQGSCIHYYPSLNVQWDYFNGNKVGSHFNSTYIYDDKLYLLAHNFNNPSFLLEVEYPELVATKIHKFGEEVKWAHNIWATEDFLLVGDGGEGFLYDNKTQSRVWTVEEDIKYLVRGFAATKEHLYVGCSPNVPVRGERYSSQYKCLIYKLDINTFKIVKRIELEQAKAINCIRLLDVKDECHNGIIMPTETILDLAGIE